MIIRIVAILALSVISLSGCGGGGGEFADDLTPETLSDSGQGVNDSSGDDGSGDDSSGDDSSGDDSSGNDSSGNDSSGNDSSGNDGSGNDGSGDSNIIHGDIADHHVDEFVYITTLGIIYSYPDAYIWPIREFGIENSPNGTLTTDCTRGGRVDVTFNDNDGDTQFSAGDKLLGQYVGCETSGSFADDEDGSTITLETSRNGGVELSFISSDPKPADQTNFDRSSRFKSVATNQLARMIFTDDDGSFNSITDFSYNDEVFVTYRKTDLHPSWDRYTSMDYEGGDAVLENNTDGNVYNISILDQAGFFYHAYRNEEGADEYSVVRAYESLDAKLRLNINTSGNGQTLVINGTYGFTMTDVEEGTRTSEAEGLDDADVIYGESVIRGVHSTLTIFWEGTSLRAELDRNNDGQVDLAKSYLLDEVR